MHPLIIIILLDVYVSHSYKPRVGATSTITQEEEIANREQNTQEGIYNLLQPLEDKSNVMVYILFEFC